RTLIERFIARANSHLERWETVKRFTILDHEFTVDDGGVTPNQKLRRSIIVAQHQAEVEAMYADENEATA
ncbi:MAG TPA: long-chain fatty acid--CoA ligase, partial [Propionibacteriaceae bacterium]|nr:long-chain fatty acid--CoA ligase [Propionibacteriaceae bacterium]